MIISDAKRREFSLCRLWPSQSSSNDDASARLKGAQILHIKTSYVSLLSLKDGLLSTDKTSKFMKSWHVPST